MLQFKNDSSPPPITLGLALKVLAVTALVALLVGLGAGCELGPVLGERARCVGPGR